MDQIDDSDPTSWSDERLLRHAVEFCELPLMPGITRSMTDEDVQFHSDVLYLRGLLTAIHEHCIDQGVKVAPLPSSSALDVVLAQAKDWPVARAEVLLREWRGTEEAAA